MVDPGKINVSLPVKQLLSSDYSFIESDIVNTGVNQLNSYFVSKAKVYS